MICARTSCAHGLEQLLAVLPAALDQLGDRVAGLVGLHLAGLHQVLHQRLGPALGEGREGQAGVDVALEEVVLGHARRAYERPPSACNS